MIAIMREFRALSKCESVCIELGRAVSFVGAEFRTDSLGPGVPVHSAIAFMMDDLIAGADRGSRTAGLSSACSFRTKPPIATRLATGSLDIADRDIRSGRHDAHRSARSVWATAKRPTPHHGGRLLTEVVGQWNT